MNAAEFFGRVRSSSGMAFPYAVLRAAVGRIRRTLNSRNRLTVLAAVVLLSAAAVILPLFSVNLRRSPDGFFAFYNILLTALFALISASGLTSSRIGQSDAQRIVATPLSPRLQLIWAMLMQTAPAFHMMICTLLMSGFLHRVYGLGLAVIAALAVSCVVTALLAMLTRTVLFVIISGLKRYRLLAAPLFYAVMTLWVLIAIVISRGEGVHDRFTAAFTSPFGMTLPGGGWCTALILMISGGPFTASLGGLLLCPAYIALLILLIMLIRTERFGAALLILGVNGRRNPHLVRPAAEGRLRSALVRLICRVPKGDGPVKAEVCRIIETGIGAPLALTVLRTVLMCALAALVMHDAGSKFAVITAVTALSVYGQLMVLSGIERVYHTGIAAAVISHAAAAVPAAAAESVITMTVSGIIIGLSCPQIIAAAAVRFALALVLSAILTLSEQLCDSRPAAFVGISALIALILTVL